MSAVEWVADEVLVEGLDDWVLVDTVIGAAHEAVEGDGGDFRPVAVAAIDYLIGNGLMVAGDIGDTGFEPWPESPPAMARRVIEKCESFDWVPLGDACWLANTERGARRGRERQAQA
jgi:hypothetical protein